MTVPWKRDGVDQGQGTRGAPDEVALIVALADVPNALERVRASAAPFGVQVGVDLDATVEMRHKFAKLTGPMHWLKAMAAGQLQMGFAASWTCRKRMVLMSVDRAGGSPQELTTFVQKSLNEVMAPAQPETGTGPAP